jgi:hypothetical protein
MTLNFSSEQVTKTVRDAAKGDDDHYDNRSSDGCRERRASKNQSNRQRLWIPESQESWLREDFGS